MKHEELKKAVIWAVTHYGLVNTDGIIQHLKKVVEELDVQPKRKPLPDGTLPLTGEEVKEFAKIFDYLPIEKITIESTPKHLYITRHMDYDYVPKVYTIDNYKAIEWLAERFELVGED